MYCPDLVGLYIFGTKHHLWNRCVIIIFSPAALLHFSQSFCSSGVTHPDENCFGTIYAWEKKKIFWSLICLSASESIVKHVSNYMIQTTQWQRRDKWLPGIINHPPDEWKGYRQEKGRKEMCDGKVPWTKSCKGAVHTYCRMVDLSE